MQKPRLRLIYWCSTNNIYNTLYADRSFITVVYNSSQYQTFTYLKDDEVAGQTSTLIKQNREILFYNDRDKTVMILQLHRNFVRNLDRCFDLLYSLIWKDFF